MHEVRSVREVIWLDSSDLGRVQLALQKAR